MPDLASCLCLPQQGYRVPVFSRTLANAFPPAAHQWVLDTLEVVLVLPAFINISIGMMHCVYDVGSPSPGFFSFPYYIIGGVIQGCPSVVVLLVISFNTFSAFLERLVERDRLSITRACADDLVGTLFFLCIDVVKVFHCVLDFARRFAHLNVNMSKRCLVHVRKVLPANH